jgi:hypothetical protein
MKVNDYVSVSDSRIRGVVVVKRADGTVVLRKENMIVQSGRRFIRDKFIASAIPALNSPVAFETDLTGFQLRFIGFGRSDVASEYDMESLVSEEVSQRSQITSQNVSAEGDSMFIKFNAEMDRTSEATGFTVREIGLIMTKEEEDLLFSRVVFDPITVSPGERYEIEYYIYF